MIFGAKARERPRWLLAGAAITVSLGAAGCGEKSEPAVHPPTTAPTISAPVTTTPPATTTAPPATPTPTAPKPKTTP